ncbi:MAG: hypothetical protein KAJ98_09060, partial [Spirochaetaceae bacterium]|nr:hypothetical protein [Spirochaetaceae bacterium]
LHTIHGRALAFATGVKLANPGLDVIVFTGDGDALAIGGNHFIHAARRNLDMTAIIMNNHIYGMTGGQFSPLSGPGTTATTAPRGSIDPAFDAMDLAKAAGATYAARTTTFHVRELQKMLTGAITHKGFSVVEVFSQCPTYYGRKNNTGDAPEMLKAFRDGTVKIGSKELEENPELIPRGVFVDRDAVDYGEAYAELCRNAVSEAP